MVLGIQEGLWFCYTRKLSREDWFKPHWLASFWSLLKALFFEIDAGGLTSVTICVFEVHVWSKCLWLGHWWRRGREQLRCCKRPVHVFWMPNDCRWGLRKVTGFPKGRQHCSFSRASTWTPHLERERWWRLLLLCLFEVGPAIFLCPGNGSAIRRHEWSGQIM